jgi:hypothetical protein
MPDTSNISFPSSPIRTNVETNSQNYYQRHSTQNKKGKKVSKLRIGEIVRGTINDRIDSELAFVQIPTGTFKAKIIKNLQKNDSLLFKVMEINPQLVLKVYEVSTGAKKNSINPSDLLRMLDVVSDDFHLSLIKKLIDKRSSIRRDDLLELIKTFTLLGGRAGENNTQDEIFDLLIEMQDGKLPNSGNLIKKLLPLFVSENKISDSLNLIHDFISEDKTQTYSKLKEFYKDIEENNYKKNNIFKISTDTNKTESFYSELKNLALGENIEQKSLKDSLDLILNLIPSLGLWNIISFTRKIPLQYFIPYYFEKNYYIIRVRQRVISSGKNEPVSFSFSIPIGESEPVRANVSAFQNQLKVYLSAANDKILNALHQYQSELKSSLSDENIEMSEFRLSLDELRDELNDIGKSHGGEHFTIVV